MLLSLVQTGCQYAETDGLALSITPHGSVVMLDTQHDTELHLGYTPSELINLLEASNMTQVHTSYVEHLLLPTLTGEGQTRADEIHTIALSPSCTVQMVIDGGATRDVYIDMYQEDDHRSISGSVFKVLRELGCSVHDNPLTSSMLLYHALIVENSAYETLHIGHLYAHELLTTMLAATSCGTYEVSPDFGTITHGELGTLITPFGLNDEEGWFTYHSAELVQRLTTFTMMVSASYTSNRVK